MGLNLGVPGLLDYPSPANLFFGVALVSVDFLEREAKAVRKGTTYKRRSRRGGHHPGAGHIPFHPILEFILSCFLVWTTTTHRLVNTMRIS